MSALRMSSSLPACKQIFTPRQEGAGPRMQGCPMHAGAPRTSSHAAYLFVICMCFLLVHRLIGG